MENREKKKKNRYRDRKKTEFTFGKWMKKKKVEKDLTPRNIITWKYSQMQDKPFGFVDVEWVEKGYFVIERNRNWAFDWDSVEAQVKIYNWKEEAVILKVTTRTERNVVGTFQYSKKKSKSGEEFGFVVPKSGWFSTDIFIAGANIWEARNGDIVWVEITSYQGKNPAGKIIDVLWKKWDVVDVDAYILEAGFSQKFDEDITEDLQKKKPNTDESEIKRRKDFREMFTFTIDGEDAKDLDDAISISQKENGDYKLYIHIADVAHYVEEKSKLDKEAFKRGTSVYLADRVIPMLPEELSNHLCSLNTESQKLSLTCEALISKSGQLVKSTLYESVIESNFRLTYKEVDEIESWKINVWDTLFCWIECTQELLDNLELSQKLKDKISVQKIEQGVLNFDFPETKLILDENKKIVEIKEYPRYRSNKMIEEFMVTANEAVSRKFAQYPFLYRIHEQPLEESREKLIVLLNLFSIDYKFKNFDTKEVWELLNILNSNTKVTEGQKKFLEKSILRTLSKAIYSEENEGHFGLGVKFYSHFTSPIRRYPDLQIHRIIKEKLQWKLNETRVIHYKKILPTVAVKTSDQERKAEKLEYRVRDYYICDYYKDKVWNQFEWVITTMLPYWCFVQLEDTAEWFIEMIPKIGPSKWYEYNEQLMRFDNPWLNVQYNLWDKINVQLDEVDMNLLRINFSIV